MEAEDAERIPRVYGRYVVHHELASGGMASVHIGRLMGPVGFSRTVAIKILHPQYAKDPEFVAMFVDEARLAARIRHPNVVSTLDVVAKGKDLLLIMDYVPGETLARLSRLSLVQGRRVPPPIVAAIVVDLLDGLHAAHEARDEHDVPLHIVHRDVSPQNVMVGHDGTARVLDFGIANATSRVQTTRDGELKGKFAYMSPEQIGREKVDRRTDVFAAGIVLWEALTGLRLFAAENPAAIVARILHDPLLPPSTLVEGVPPAVDDVVLKALARARDDRYPTADAFARALENALPAARRSDVRAWVDETANSILEERARRVADIENTPTTIRPSGTSFRIDTLPEAVVPTDIPIVQEDAPPSTAPDEAPRRQRRRLLVLVAAGGVLLCGVALGFALRTPIAPAAASSVGPAAAPPSVSTAPPAATPPPSPAVPPESAIAPSSAPSASAPAPRATASAPPPPHAAHPSPAARPPGGCDPPYTIVDGVKRWKPACL